MEVTVIAVAVGLAAFAFIWTKGLKALAIIEKAKADKARAAKATPYVGPTYARSNAFGDN